MVYFVSDRNSIVVELRNAFLVSLNPLLSEMSMQSFVFLMPSMTVNKKCIHTNRTKTL